MLTTQYLGQNTQHIHRTLCYKAARVLERLRLREAIPVKGSVKDTCYLLLLASLIKEPF